FTIVIPTYNERDRISILLGRLFEACDREGVTAEVVIVDDNSADGTGAVAEQWARQRRVRAIHRPGKRGLGTAVLEGVAVAAVAGGWREGRRCESPSRTAADAVSPDEGRAVRARRGEPLCLRRRHVRLSARSLAPVAGRVLARETAHAGAGCDVRILSHPPQP